MINAQEWLESQEQYNTKEKRATVKELYASNQKLKGDLDLSDFINLEELYCDVNNLTSLNISKCLKLVKISCIDNQLKKLDLTCLSNLEEVFCNVNELNELIMDDLPHLKVLQCRYNCLVNINYSALNPKKLVDLRISNNNLEEQELAVFGRFINLESLVIGNTDKNKIQQNQYNKFIGSLEYLKGLSKLETLNISNTNIDSGLEFLSSSIERIYCSTKEKPESKTKNIAEQLSLANFRLTNQQLGKYESAVEKRKNAQEWLDKNYPKDRVCRNEFDKVNKGKNREKVVNLDISNKQLEGKLDLSDFISLEKLNCANNYLVGIDLINNNKLKYLDLTSNNFSEQDLSILSHLINVEYLFLGNTNKEKISSDTYNRFFGSLKCLRKLSRLKILNISDTDIDSGLEYLPESLEEIICLVENRSKAKANSIKKEIESYVSDNIRRKKKKHWLNYGLKREEKLEEEISVLNAELEILKNGYFDLLSIDKEKMSDEANKVISNTRTLYINKKEEELKTFIGTLDKRDKYLLELLNGLGDFRQIKEKVLQENLTAESKEKFNLIQKDLEKFKMVSKKETSLISEKNELKTKKNELKTELKQLLSKANNKLDKASQYLLRTMLKTQVEIVNLESDPHKQEKLNELKYLLTKKGVDVENFCQKQEIIAKLEEIFKLSKFLQNEDRTLQLQIEILSK